MIGFPLLLIPLAVFNIIVFLMPGVAFTAALFALPLPSGAQWDVTLGDILIAGSILLLLLEVIKGARPFAKYFTDHLLAFLVMAAAFAEFILLPQFGTSTFFLLCVLTFVDFVSGIALHARRGGASRKPAPAPVPAPIQSPAPAGSASEPAPATSAQPVEPVIIPAPVPTVPAVEPAPPVPTPAPSDTPSATEAGETNQPKPDEPRSPDAPKP